MDPGQRPAAALPDARFLILCFTAGLLAVHALPALPPPAWVLPLPAVLLLPHRWRWSLSCAVLGVLLAYWRADALLDQRWPSARHGDEIVVEGSIVSLPERQPQRATSERGTGTTWRFQFEPHAAQDLPLGIRVSWYRSEETLRGGDCWQLKLRLRPPRGSLNPGGFDYEGWLFRQHIGATATVREGRPCPQHAGPSLTRWRERQRETLHQALGAHPALGLLTALTLGDASGIGDDEWDVFRLTGTTHLVAISGFNLAIVAGFAFFLLRWLWSAWPRLCLWLPAQKFALLGSVAAAGGYALLAGFEPPVARAFWMLLILATAAWMHRLGAPSRALALAWLAILLVDPLAITSPGLWLSFGAVAAIFYVMTHRLQQPGVLRSLLLLQLMLSLLLAPMSLYFFHGASGSGVLVNLVAVPLFALLTPVLLVGLLLLWVVPAAGGVWLAHSADLLVLVREALGWAATQFPQLWLAASPPPAALLLAGAGAVAIFAPRGLPLRVPGLLCLLPLLLPPGSAPAEGFELTVLDVGQGLSAVVRTPHHALLYDAGPAFEDGFDAGASVVAPFLLSRGLRDLDVLLLSHGDNDHAGGARTVRRLLRVRRELGPGGQPCFDGERWDWDGVRFETLHPDRSGGWSDNNGSCVLRVEWQGHVALLAGDIEQDAEERLLRDHGANLRAELLLAPHHGSKTSSSEDFVRAVGPRLVMYGAAWRSHFGHPRPEVVARYRAQGARQFATGNSGALTWRPGGAVDEWRRTGPRFWNSPAVPLE